MIQKIPWLLDVIGALLFMAVQVPAVLGVVGLLHWRWPTLNITTAFFIALILVAALSFAQVYVEHLEAAR